MRSCCSSCGQDTAMYCAKCLYKEQQNNIKLKAEVERLKKELQAAELKMRSLDLAALCAISLRKHAEAEVERLKKEVAFWRCGGCEYCENSVENDDCNYNGVCCEDRRSGFVLKEEVGMGFGKRMSKLLETVTAENEYIIEFNDVKNDPTSLMLMARKAVGHTLLGVRCDFVNGKGYMHFEKTVRILELEEGVGFVEQVQKLAEIYGVSVTCLKYEEKGE